MKIKSSFLVLIFLLISCESKEPNFSKEMIKKLATQQKEIDGIISIPRFMFLDLYVLTTNGEVHRSKNNELLYFYNEYYSNEFKSFEEFLNIVLNQEFILEKRLFRNPSYLESFKLNPEIEKEYSDLGFNEFLKKYSKKTNKKNAEFELNKSIIKQDEYLTIVYFLYKNRYDIGIDCYIGKDYIRKREESFK